MIIVNQFISSDNDSTLSAIGIQPSAAAMSGSQGFSHETEYFQLHKPDDRPSIDKSTMELSAETESWQNLWQEHRETLLNQLNTAWYSQELRKVNTGLF